MKNTSGLLLGLLGIAFVVLKLCKIINWSWWYVTMPFWISALLAVIIFIIYISIKVLSKDEIIKPEIKSKSRFQQRLEEMENKRKSL